MNGRDYIARVRLSTRGDKTLAVEGQTCENVPEGSLQGLLDCDLIYLRPELAGTHKPTEEELRDVFRPPDDGDPQPRKKRSRR